jgi:hypothetical protein
VSRATWLPFALLLAYGVAFASRAFGVAPLAFDDHPGQLARLLHVVREGPAPWAWNTGWWAGYPEMQFYPPGWFYVGASLSWVSFGVVSPTAAYQVMLWTTYLAPGLATFVLLHRLLGDGWCALPGAFAVLAFAGDPAGGSASGVEGGTHVGMVAARLGWALLPLLSLALAPWTSGGGRFPRAAVVVLTAIVLTHPAHTPAAVAVLVAAALVSPARRALACVTVAALAALGLAAFWLVPLLAHLAETRALAWGALARSAIATPFTAMLVAFALLAVTRRRSAAVTATLHAVWLALLGVGLDALVVEPLGLRFLPTDRVADGAWILLLVASGLGAGVVVDAVSRRVPPLVAAGVVIVTLVAFSLPGRALALWPRAADWPSYATVSQGLRLDDLWRAIREAPPGRVLFIRSGAPLVYGSEWYRPHTHVTALTPWLTGRAIIGGTFTHGAPVAAFVYRGDAGSAPITRLAEQLDGVSLFGWPLDALDAPTFQAYARRLRIAAVVALEDDAGHLAFLADPPYRRRSVPPFLVFFSNDAPAPIRPLGGSRWEVTLDGAGEWRSTGVAFSPLWRAERNARPIATRRGLLGDLEVRTGPGVETVRLAYGPGGVEVAALALSAAALFVLIVDGWRRYMGGSGRPPNPPASAPPA